MLGLPEKNLDKTMKSPQMKGLGLGTLSDFEETFELEDHTQLEMNTNWESDASRMDTKILKIRKEQETSTEIEQQIASLCRFYGIACHTSEAPKGPSKALPLLSKDFLCLTLTPITSPTAVNPPGVDSVNCEICSDSLIRRSINPLEKQA